MSDNNPFLIENCMRKDPVTVKADSNIYEAIQLILEHRITGLTVVDDNRNVIGVVSELDCLKAVVSTIYNDGQANQALVGDFMTRDVVECSPEEDIVKVAQSMLEQSHRRRPVTQDGKLVGQLSCRNVLWAMMEYAEKNISNLDK
jgi:CBS domain-containing protein